MNRNGKNSYIDFLLSNGKTVKLTLTFGKLNVLKSVDNAKYQQFNKIMAGKSEEILDLVTVIYVAYWCANFGQDNLLKEKDFIELVPFDMLEIERTFNALTKPKKK